MRFDLAWLYNLKFKVTHFSNPYASEGVVLWHMLLLNTKRKRNSYVVNCTIYITVSDLEKVKPIVTHISILSSERSRVKAFITVTHE